MFSKSELEKIDLGLSCYLASKQKSLENIKEELEWLKYIDSLLGIQDRYSENEITDIYIIERREMNISEIKALIFKVEELLKTMHGK